MNQPSSRNPKTAVFLSVLLPGTGQLYVGDRPTGLSLLFIDLGIVVSVLLSGSRITAFFMAGVYLAVLIPAARDAARAAAGRPQDMTSKSLFYVVAMLLLTGPFALPLLWQNKRFTRTGKVLWTFFVLFIALLFIATLAVLGPLLEFFTG